MENYWLKHSHNSRNATGMPKIRSEFGPVGYALYWMLIEIMMEADGWLHRTDLDGLELMLGVTSDTLYRFVDRAIEIGMFRADGEQFTTDPVLESLAARLKASRKAQTAAYARHGRDALDDGAPSTAPSNAKSTAPSNPPSIAPSTAPRIPPSIETGESVLEALPGAMQRREEKRREEHTLPADAQSVGGTRGIPEAGEHPPDLSDSDTHHGEASPWNPQVQRPTEDEVIVIGQRIGVNAEDARGCFLYFDRQDWLTSKGIPITNIISALKWWGEGNRTERYDRQRDRRASRSEHEKNSLSDSGGSTGTNADSTGVGGYRADPRFRERFANRSPED